VVVAVTAIPLLIVPLLLPDCIPELQDSQLVACKRWQLKEVVSGFAVDPSVERCLLFDWI